MSPYRLKMRISRPHPRHVYDETKLGSSRGCRAYLASKATDVRPDLAISIGVDAILGVMSQRAVTELVQGPGAAD
jgi:hypothetical protein